MKHKVADINRMYHILESIANIEIILEGVDEESFIHNLEKRLAVERLLEIIGEAINHISEEVLYSSNQTSTPWKQIIALRNVIAHEYFRIDYDVVYKIAVNNIIPLKEDINKILKDLK